MNGSILTAFPIRCPTCAMRVEVATVIGRPERGLVRLGLDPCRHNTVVLADAEREVNVAQMRDPFFQVEEWP